MARQAGLDYYPMSVDMLDDDKVYGIMTEAGGGNRRSAKGWMAKAWLDELLGQVFSNGFALEMTRGRTEDIANRLGTSTQRLYDFIGICVRNGFFDECLWEKWHVLTSAGIQRRYAVACKRSVKSLVGPWVIDVDGIIPEIDRNEPKSTEIDRSSPKSSAKEKEKEEKKEEEEAGESVPDSMAAEAPCLTAQEEGLVFLDLGKSAHRTAMGSIGASYTAVGGRDFQGFMRKMRGLCPPSCRGDPRCADECYTLVMGALAKFDPAKGRDPWPLVKTILEQERGTR